MWGKDCDHMELFMGARNLQSWDSLTPLPVPIPLTLTIYFDIKDILKANFNYEGTSHWKKGEGLVAGAYVFYLLMSNVEVVQ